MAEVKHAADLYALDPAEFTAARNALAKRLRSEGQKEKAAQVARLRRPPATAWALNMVARRRPEVIAEVLDRGAELRAAMELAVGGDASALRAAHAGERRAVEAATTAAAAYLEPAGHAPTDVARQRMVATLRAAVVDDAVAALLRDGVLEADHDQPGFGIDTMKAGSAPAAGLKAKAERPDDEIDPERRAPSEQLQREVDQLVAQSQHLEAEARAAEDRAVETRGCRGGSRSRSGCPAT